MATSAPTFYGVVREGSDAEFRATLSSGAGVALLQANIFSIDLIVYQGNTTTIMYTAPALTYTAAANIYDTPQTDGWTLGGSGYTFKANVPASAVAMDGGENYRYEWKFTLVSAATPKPVAFALFMVNCAPLTSQ